MATPMGIIPVTEYTASGKIFNLIVNRKKKGVDEF